MYFADDELKETSVVVMVVPTLIHFLSLFFDKIVLMNVQLNVVLLLFLYFAFSNFFSFIEICTHQVSLDYH